MADLGGCGGGMPAQLLERLAAREARRKAAETTTTGARHRGEAVGGDVLLPSLSLPMDPSDVAGGEVASIFISPMHNTPTFFLEHMARAKTLLLGRIERLRERCALTEGAPEPDERIKSLDDLLDQIEELQRWFTECSPYLKSFHVEQARQDVDEIKSRFHDVRASVLPKKKFKFGAGGGAGGGAKASTKKTPAVTTSTSPAKQTPTFSSLLAPAKFTLSHLSHRHDLRLPSSTDDGDGESASLRDQSLCLTDLVDCEVRVTSVCGNLVASRLTGCTVYTLQPVATSVMLQDCVNCRFVLACRQLRVHRTRGTRFDVFTASAPIIEDSTDLSVGPWSGGRSTSEVLGAVNHWKEVQDFSCPTLVTTKASQSPNWSPLPENEWLKEEQLEAES
ncbi:tubulin specific chaperone C [Echinococcus multilocularis]|uniref:Tubulin specific chaperone C n=1 Tax=Echinococcus multilocularis TaxID=6211 RepID=A0A068Y425_ECHMU|nr:tubulin specific chaperone C [Echinococcus multilocularis]